MNAFPNGGPKPGPVMQVWARLGDGLAAISTLLIAVLMALICADAFARNVFGGSLPLVSELGAAMLVVIVYLALATTIRNNRMARTDVFLAWLAVRSPRGAAVLSAVYDLIGAALLGLITWAGVLTLAKDFEGGKYLGIQGVVTFPLWPFGAAFVIGLVVAAVQFLLQAVHALRGGSARIGGGLE